MRRLLCVALALTIAGACGGPTATTAANQPQPGEVLFGTGFDSLTGLLAGHLTSVRAGGGASFAAAFSSAVQGGPLKLAMALDEEVLNIQSIDVPDPPWRTYGGDLPRAALAHPGLLVLVFTDANGNALALGALTITP